jgi:hypothetical protein
MQFKYSRHQTGGTLRDQGSGGGGCRNFCCDVAAGPLRCEMVGEGNWSTDGSKTPKELTRLLRTISRFRGQGANSQSKNPSSRYETCQCKAGLMYSNAWGWFSMSEKTLISAVVSLCLRAFVWCTSNVNETHFKLVVRNYFRYLY